MSNYKLSYFDFDGGRGEDCRLALTIAGADFDDDRVKGVKWPERKPQTPFGNLPVLEIEGRGRLGQSNAVLTFIGRSHGLHPTDLWEAARHEALMAFTEELRERIGPTLRIKDEDDKRQAREEFAAGYMQGWGARVQDQIGAGPFMAGDSISVVDLKLFVAIGWFVKGIVDYVPTYVFADFPKVMALYEAVASHPKVKAYYAARA